MAINEGVIISESLLYPCQELAVKNYSVTTRELLLL